MEKIPSAEETLKKFYFNLDETFNIPDIHNAMIEFAKLHVEAALKVALDEVPYGSSTDTTSYDDVKGILTCYPLENIK
jgi:hypothetical protein